MTTITIQTSELANALGVIQPFFMKKTPPLSCVQLRLKDKRLELFASLGFEGGSVYAAIPVPFKGRGMQWQMLDGQSFVDVLALSTSPTLELTFTETSLVIQDIGSRATLKLIQLPGLAEDTFPKQDTALTLDGMNFTHMVRVGEAASDDIARATLTGLFLHADPAKNEMTSVAADGFILSIAALSVQSNSAGESISGVYSADALARLVRATKPTAEDLLRVTARKADMLVSLARGNLEAVFLIPLLGKDYVDYAQVLRKSAPDGMKVVVQKKLLESFIRRARTISGSLYLQAKGGYLWLLAQDEEKKIGRTVDCLPFEGDAAATSPIMAYGMNVLRQAILSSVAQEEITITFPAGEKVAPAMVAGAFASVIAMPLARNQDAVDPFEGLPVPQPALLPA